MSIDLVQPSVIDLDRGGYVWEPDGACCDLCRREEELFRLFGSADALCRGCFAMWHG
jgi:hypothetical protein